MYEDFRLPKIELLELLKRATQNKKLADTLIKEFGPDILDDKKEVNINLLNDTIIVKEPLKKKFRGIIEFPLLIELVKELFERAKKGKEPIVFDAPYLFDFVFLPYGCYPNLVVFNTEGALPVKRVAERDHISIREASKIVATPQARIGHMLKKSELQIDNDGDLGTLKFKLINQLGPYLM